MILLALVLLEELGFAGFERLLFAFSYKLLAHLLCKFESDKIYDGRDLIIKQ
ncbi:hypothetical protein [Pedobacter kyonggii]|uniref:hypothetical protein n=1 Tax=Pedobacter kyonggii TaxID=1926871 RepID=UPI0013EF5822|nr:hypothetical protein [Pedobacter kyonggii]